MPSSLRQDCSRTLRIGLLSLALASAGVALAQPAAALCINRPETGTWFNPVAFTSPSKLVVQQTDCEQDPDSEFLVDLTDSVGNVADRLPGDYARANDGLNWLRVEPFSDGEYIEHVWVLTRGSSSVRVWIAYEALDGAGDFVTDDIFSKTPPTSDADCSSCHENAEALPAFAHDALVLQAVAEDVGFGDLELLETEVGFSTGPAMPTCTGQPTSQAVCASEATVRLDAPVRPRASP